MASTQTQIRRGTESQCEGQVPALSEQWHDTTKNRIRMGDGSKPGGFEFPNYIDIHNNAMTYAITTNSGNDYSVSLGISLDAYVDGGTVRFKANAANTGAARLNVDGLGFKNLKKISGGALADLASGDLISGGYYEARYDGTQYQVIIPVANANNIGQGQLNTSTGSVFTTTGASAGGQMLILPGGQYGFYPQIAYTRVGSSGSYVADIVNSGAISSPGTFANTTYIRLQVNGTSGSHLDATQRYINASPPYDLGDGDVSGFMYALVNKDGDIVSGYIADVPPWAYNGPTNLTPDDICMATGKKMKRVFRAKNLDTMLKSKKPRTEMIEIDHAMKNIDMALIPHPFTVIPDDHTVILLDPMDERINTILAYQNSGGQAEIINMIMKGYLKPDNGVCKRCGPPGVKVAKLRYK